AATTAGCLFGQGASPKTVVQTRASNEFSCAKEKLQIQELGGTSFKATGCGMTATYTCMGGNLGNPYDAMCTREGNATPVSGVTETQK
ncbi:MAG TPA: hypothetical protein VIY73_23915, partial [Polyangiaceae bacterium]